MSFRILTRTRHRRVQTVRCAALVVALALPNFAALSATDPSDYTWVPHAKLVYYPTKIGRSNDALKGKMCFPWGAAFSCGTTSTIPAGTSAEMSGSFSHSGFSLDYAHTHTMDQSFSYTAGDEIVRWMVCYDNAELAQWFMRYYSEGVWSHETSVLLFDPGDSVSVVTCRTPTVCNPPQSVSSGITVPVSGGQSSVYIDLEKQAETTSGTPPPGHPLAGIWDYLAELSSSQKQHIMRTVTDLADYSGQTIERMVIRDIDGTLHSFDLTVDPDPFDVGPYHFGLSVDTDPTFDPSSGDGVFTVTAAISDDGSQEATDGFGLAIQHNPALLAATDVRLLSAFDSMNGGTGPTLVFPTIMTNGVTLGVLYDLTGVETYLLPSEPLPVAEIDYTTNATGLQGVDEPVETLLSWPPDLAGNPNAILLGSEPVEVNGRDLPVILLPASPFSRGDCNADSAINIADAILMLGILFPAPDSTQLEASCEDACDANDDGVFNLADAVRLLGALFGDGVPLPAPQACGVDETTGDALGCETSTCL